MSLNPIINRVFLSSFEDRCFRLLTKAYDEAVIESKVIAGLEENDISAILNQKIECNPLSIRWKIFCKTEYSFFNNKEGIKRGFAAEQKRIDFIMTCFTSKTRAEYFFEAKNLKQKDSKLKRRYIETGINSFVSGKYKNGSLVGYLLAGKLDLTIESINSLLRKDERGSEILVKQINPICADYYESGHSSFGTLKHVIFDFTL